MSKLEALTHEIRCSSPSRVLRRKVKVCLGKFISNISVLCVVKNNCSFGRIESIIRERTAFSMSL